MSIDQEYGCSLQYSSVKWTLVIIMATEGQSVDLAGAPRQQGPQSPGGSQPSRQSHSGAGRASGAGTPLDLDHPRMAGRDRSPDSGDSYAETDEQNNNTITIRNATFV